MIYRKVIIETDDEILKDVNITHLAKIVGCDVSYLNQVKNNRRVCNEDFRNRVIEAKTKLPK